jgi:hypothetical protein
VDRTGPFNPHNYPRSLKVQRILFRVFSQLSGGAALVDGNLSRDASLRKLSFDEDGAGYGLAAERVGEKRDRQE